MKNEVARNRDRIMKIFIFLLWLMTITVMVILKMTSMLHWSWLWTLSPLWIPGSIFLILFLGMSAWFTISVSKTKWRS